MTDDLNREQARKQLAAADRLAEAAARRAAPIAAITTASVGVLVGFASAAAYFTLPDHKPVFVVTLALYAAAIALLMWWNHRTRMVTHRGFGKAYRQAFALTIAFYTVGIAFLVAEWPWPLATAYCIAVPVPMVIEATRIWRGRR